MQTADFRKSCAAGMDRTYSLDALPQEYPSLGTGDYRNIALNIKNEKGVESADLLLKAMKSETVEYRLQGLPGSLGRRKGSADTGNCPRR